MMFDSDEVGHAKEPFGKTLITAAAENFPPTYTLRVRS